MSNPTQPPASTVFPSPSKTDALIAPKWLIRLCRPSRMLWLAPLIGFIITIPSLFSGYMLDDHFLKLNGVDQSTYRQRPAWDYFNFITSEADFNYYRERGILLSWWSHESFRSHFFRPVASLVHAFQFRNFGDKPWIMHAGLMLLYALLILLCVKLLTELSFSPAAAGLGALLFAINDAHAFTAGWISAYNTLLCCIFGLFALLMFIRWRKRQSTAGLLIFVGTFILALLCSEGALALMGYIIAYVIFMEPGTIRKKAGALAPGMIIAIGYVLFYSLNHLGVKGSGIYQSPGNDLLRSIVAVSYKTPMQIVSQIVSLPPVTMILTAPPIWRIGVVIGLLLFIGFVFIFRRVLTANKSICFFGTAMILSIIPFAMGPLQDRLLLWSGLGAAGFLGELFTMRNTAFNKLARPAARTLLFTNLVISLLFYVPTLFAMKLLDNPSQALAAKITPASTVVLNAPWDIFSWYPPAMCIEKGKTWPEHFYFFYTGPDTLVVKRTGERTLSATTRKGWFFAPEYERFSRANRFTFKPGDTAKLELMTATIKKTTSDGRPLNVDFSFKSDLSEFAWMKWSKNGPVTCPVPAVGQEVRLFASFP